MSKTTYSTYNQAIRTLSENRKLLLNKLEQRKWFQNTDLKLKEKILTLPEDWDGYITDLANRKDEVGGMDVLELVDLQHGDFVALTRFRCRVQATNEVINYGEYETSKYGSNPGFKGILLLEQDGLIKYFVLKKSEKFPIGSLVYDSIGGMIQFKNGELLNMPKRIEEEIKRQLGLKELTVNRFIDLGQMHTDVGRSSNHVSIFAAVIDINKRNQINELRGKNITSTKRISFEVVIEPIEKINQYIHKVDDSFFLSCVARLASMGIIRIL